MSTTSRPKLTAAAKRDLSRVAQGWWGVGMCHGPATQLLINGLIEPKNHPGTGYRLTDAGVAYLAR